MKATTIVGRGSYNGWPAVGAVMLRVIGTGGGVCDAATTAHEASPNDAKEIKRRLTLPTANALRPPAGYSLAPPPLHLTGPSIVESIRKIHLRAHFGHGKMDTRKDCAFARSERRYFPA